MKRKKNQEMQSQSEHQTLEVMFKLSPNPLLQPTLSAHQTEEMHLSSTQQHNVHRRMQR